MAAATKTITIRFKGDASGLNKTAKNSEKALGKFAAGFGGTLRRVGETAAGVFGAQVFDRALGAVQDFVGGSVSAFSNLNESLNAVDKIFGTSAGEIKKWGEQNANALGLSTRAFNELAVPLGAMLKNAGLPLAQVTGWTEKLTERAADMASVFNVDVSEALEAIQAGLRGEADPLERFGVSLSAAKVEAAALAETGKKTAKDLTDQEKATARLNLIMAQTASTAGDFRGTSDGLANSQRIAAAKTEELQAKIGEKLAPVVQQLTKFKLKLVEVLADKLVPALTSLSKWASENKPIMIALAIVVGTALVVAFTAWAVSATMAAAATIAATWPVLAVIAAIAALVVGVWLLVKNWDTIWAWIKRTAKAIGNWFSTEFVKPFKAAWNAITSGVSAAGNWIKDRFNSIVGWFQSIPGRIGAALGKLADFISAPFRSAFSAIARLWNRTVGRLSFTIPGWVPGIGGNGFSMPTLPTFHQGGIVPGPIGRPVPILALGGERVLTREQQRQSMGPEVLELHLDLGRGIQQVVTVNLREHDRNMRRRAMAGARS